jgi:hypothetical protein
MNIAFRFEARTIDSEVAIKAKSGVIRERQKRTKHGTVDVIGVPRE